MSLFGESTPPAPLAERLRPKSLDQVLGQSRAVSMLEAFLARGTMPHIVFWGPPGTGKTTMSRLLASLLDWEGRSINASSASVKDIRELAAEARNGWQQYERRTLVFIDEIHRLNKGQQDVLLPILEAGTFVLAGSTTENPYFSLNQALRSRVQLIQLEPLGPDTILEGMQGAVAALGLEADPEALQWVATRTGGDLRLAFTVLESASMIARATDEIITLDHVTLCLRQTQVSGDRKGDNHYDLASAFQKSLRGSDANAAIYYLVRFLESGEDPLFVARRLLVTAAEDVGNADPQALVVAGHAFRAVQVLGLPEGRIPLAQAALYVARAPKSNEAVEALGKAATLIRNRRLDPIPPHLRDSHYKGAKDLGHGVGYVYSHKHPEKSQIFLPEEIAHEQFVRPGKRAQGREEVPAELLERLLETLRAKQAEADHFEIEAQVLAEALDVPEPVIRAGLNLLVQKGQLTFKRVFRLAEAETPAAKEQETEEKPAEE